MVSNPYAENKKNYKKKFSRCPPGPPGARVAGPPPDSDSQTARQPARALFVPLLVYIITYNINYSPAAGVISSCLA